MCAPGFSGRLCQPEVALNTTANVAVEDGSVNILPIVAGAVTAAILLVVLLASVIVVGFIYILGTNFRLRRSKGHPAQFHVVSYSVNNEDGGAAVGLNEANTEQASKDRTRIVSKSSSS